MTALLTVLYITIQATLLLAPGLIMGLWLYHKKHLPLWMVVPVGAGLAALLSYTAFWPYLANRRLGQIYTLVLFLTAVGACYLLSRKPWRQLLRRTVIIAPLALLLLSSVFYSALTFGCRAAHADPPLNRYCQLYTFGMDNTMSYQFADNVYHGHAKQLIGDWQGSDRPPLQSGILLAQSPLLFGRGAAFIQQQTLSVLLQCFWILGVWVFARGFRLSRWHTAMLYGFCFVTSFFMLETVYTWPKMLAAGLTLSGIGLLWFLPPSYIRWALAGLLIGAGYLSHTSTIFTIIPLLPLLFLKRYAPLRRYAIAAAGGFAACLLPWLWYQKVYDPPGDRLIRWFFAGDQAPTSQRSAVRDILHAHKNAELGAFLQNKWSNLRTPFGTWPPNTPVYDTALIDQTHGYHPTLLGKLRGMEFYFMFYALAAAHAGWIAYCFKANRLRLRHSGVVWRHLRNTLYLGITATLFWALSVFAAGTTVVHGGSYVTMLLLFVGLFSLAVAALPKKIVWLLLIAAGIYYLAIWIITWWTQPDRSYDISAILLCVLSGCGIMMLLRWFARTPAHRNT